MAVERNMARVDGGIDMTGWLILAGAALFGQNTETENDLRQALQALSKKNHAQARQFADKVLKVDPKNDQARATRAHALEGLGKFSDALADWNVYLERHAKEYDPWFQRGCVHFKNGQFKESVQDFDRSIEVRPEAKRHHWQRGISCYYAGLFDEGTKQFEVYQDFDNADVENAVWRFMCMARKENVAKARSAILTIGNDRRVPMRQVYDMFKGTLQPDDVMNAARQGDSKTQARQLFYAHLYVGIYYDLAGDGAKALDHVSQSASDAYRIDHYMGDVARIHRDVLRRELKK